MARHLWLQIYLTIKAPFVLKVFQNGACLSHTSRVKFFCQLCVIPSVYTHHSAADSQWVYLKFVGLAIDMLNMKYLTFPCEHILKRHGLLFLVCKYFIITVFVTTSCDGLKVEKNRIVLRTRSAYLYVLFVWPYYQIDIFLFLGSMVMAFVCHFYSLR